MKKTILNLGKALDKAEQKIINGGYKETDKGPIKPDFKCFTELLCGSCTGRCVPCYYDGEPGYKCIGGNLAW